MKRRTKNVAWVVVLILLVLSAGDHRAYGAETRISIGVTETMETFNPYGDSVSLMYSIWCQVLGCLGTYDFDKGQHVGTAGGKVGGEGSEDLAVSLCARTIAFTTARR